MASFSVAFNIAATTMPTDDQYDQATDRLAHLAPHLGEDDQGRLEVAISVDADNPVAALADATSIVLNALDPALGVSRASVVHAEAMTGQERERRNDQPFPELWGTAEVVAYRGGTRQAVNKWANTHPDVVPPVADLAAGKVWRASTWRRLPKARAGSTASTA